MIEHFYTWSLSRLGIMVMIKIKNLRFYGKLQAMVGMVIFEADTLQLLPLE